MKSIYPGILFGCLLSASALGAASASSDPAAWRVLPQAQSHAAGIYLNEIVENLSTPLPHIRLAPAPVPGQATVLNRTQFAELVRQAVPELSPTGWSGATQVRVTRRMRALEDVEVKEMLTAALQRDLIKDRGELELRMTRPWPSALIADEPFALTISDLPTAGVTPNFVIRFELRAGQALLGNWQVPVQARIWREVWVAGSPLQRGQLLREADIVRERRDVLTIRDALPILSREEPGIELAENLTAGTPLTLRSLRLRPIVQRGRVVEAIVQEGSLVISVKAEVLEDGRPGQTIRARNLKSKREFRGKVQNEETILVAL